MKHLILLFAFLIPAMSSFGQAPTTNATDPEARNAEDVISIFSGAYTDVVGTNYNPNWGQSGFANANTSYDPGTGNLVLAYPGFNYQGNVLGSVQNISAMEFLHVDIWVNGTFDPRIVAISSGAEIPQTITNTGAATWISVDIPVAGITNDPTQVKELKFDGGNGSTDSIYVDNVYFWKTATTPQNDATLSDLQVDGTTVTDFSSDVTNYTVGLASGTTTIPQITTATTTEVAATTTITQATGIPGVATVEVVSDDSTRTKTYTVSFAITTPGVAAPAPPARDPADVISIFSDEYTDIAVDTFSAADDNSDITEVMIAGNATKRIDFTNFLRVDFKNNRQDASEMTHFHMDFWVNIEDPIGKVFNSKLVDYAGTASETSAMELNINGGSNPPLQSGTWVSIDVTLDSWANNPSVRSDLAEFVITSNLDIVYVDNIYMYKDPGATVGLPESFDAASSVNTWTTAGSAASNASEVTLEWAETAGVDASGAMRFGGTNADGNGGRAYILEKTFTDIDFAGETNVDVSVSVKTEALTDANVSILTDIAGSIQQNASANAELSGTEFTTFTFNHPTISASANTVKIQFNVAAGAVVGAGGNLLIDDISVAAAGSGGGGTEGELLTNGDFEAGRAPWTDTAGEIRTEGGNSFFFADVASAGQPFDVNLSQILELTQGETYELSFVASTGAGTSRTMIAGIGINEGDFAASTETVTLTDQSQTFTYNLIAPASSANSRVLFDMGAAAGIVVIDNVSLTVGEATTVAEPTTVAPTPPDRNSADVVSLFSNAYSNINVTTWSTDWSQGSTNTDIVVEGDDIKRFDFISPFSGIQLESALDLSNYTHMHIDYWVPDALTAGEVFNPKLSNHGNLPGADGETSAIELNNPVTESQTWVSLDVLLSDFTVAANNADRDKIYQIILGVAGTLDNVYIDNFYFYREAGTVSNELEEVPTNFALNQNYPNPFNPSTNIGFSLPQAERVTIKVYDMLGREVATLLNQQNYNAGSHQVSFDASNLSSGIYIYRLQAGNATFTKRMTLIK